MILIAGVQLLGGVLLILLFQRADLLGVWFVPLVAAYCTLVCLLCAWVIRRNELKWIRAQVGEEKFYELFPKEKRRAQRRRESSCGKEKGSLSQGKNQTVSAK